MDDPKFRSQIEVLSFVDKGRRREWTDAEKVRIVEESLRGYRQCAATARRYEISRALLTRWRREVRSGYLVSEGRPQFMAVQVASDAANSATSREPSRQHQRPCRDHLVGANVLGVDLGAVLLVDVGLHSFDLCLGVASRQVTG
ncbi:transposase [Cypionkella psychrotolerans]|uniref:transposase n=1 Tax=Cypionkella psychrotolerans TaxID=1678131 RepID=UPI0012E1A351|nr:transposase [Cypionkella psychrotolerans]